MIGIQSEKYKKVYNGVSIGEEEIVITNFENILSEIKNNVDYNSASLLVMNKSCKKLKQVAEIGDGCNLINSMNFKMGSGLSAWLAQKKRVVCLSDIHRGARHGHNPIRSFVAIPIFYHESVIGILNLAHVTPNAFGEEEVQTLQDMVESMAPQIYNLLISCNEGYK